MNSDLLFCTETWLCKPDVMPSFKGYASEHPTRDKKRGGGVAIYGKHSLKYSIHGEFSVLNRDAERLTLQLGKNTVSVIYRPPNGDTKRFISFLEKLAETGSSYIDPCIIIGDINMDLQFSGS